MEASCTTPRYRPADYLRSCVLGQTQLWIIQEGKPIGAVITTVINYPRGKWGRYLLLGADNFKHISSHELEIEAWHKAIGCKGMEMCGRKGWERLLNDGWKASHVELHKDFDGDTNA